MESTVLRHLLVLDWARIENTPAPERQTTRVEVWFEGARTLAAGDGRELEPVVAELRADAGAVARRRRHEALTDLARDLAVHHALGEDVGSSWRRRVRRLAEVMNLSSEALQSLVESRAAAIEVVIQSEPEPAS